MNMNINEEPICESWKNEVILILKLFPTSSASKVSSSSDERVMVPDGDAERESSDNSMVEAGESARDSSSGGPRRFWMSNECIVWIEKGLCC